MYILIITYPCPFLVLLICITFFQTLRQQCMQFMYLMSVRTIHACKTQTDQEWSQNLIPQTSGWTRERHKSNSINLPIGVSNFFIPFNQDLSPGIVFQMHRKIKSKKTYFTFRNEKTRTTKSKSRDFVK